MSTYVTNVYFSGQTIITTVTNDPAIVSRWISDIHQYHNSTIAGLDVEWNPFFEAGRPNPVATVQICVDRRCLIYQIIHSEYTPQSLADFLSDHDFVFVGIGVDSDLKKLDDVYGIGGNARTVDLGRLAADAYCQRDLVQKGMVELARLVLGMVVEKPRRVTMSAWDNFELTDDQVRYACIDAFVSFEIGNALNASGSY